jgi:hypothetical protein
MDLSLKSLSFQDNQLSKMVFASGYLSGLCFKSWWPYAGKFFHYAACILFRLVGQPCCEAEGS